MSDYGTIKIPREDYDRHNDRRKSMGLTWGEYIDDASPGDQVDVDAVLSRLDDLESTLPRRVGDDVEARLS